MIADFSRFFSEQARKPEVLFARMVMSVVFDQGNAFLNKFVNELMSVQTDDRIIEIGQKMLILGKTKLT